MFDSGLLLPGVTWLRSRSVPVWSVDAAKDEVDTFLTFLSATEALAESDTAAVALRCYPVLFCPITMVTYAKGGLSQGRGQSTCRTFE